MDKARAEDAELQAEELALIEKSSRLNEKRCTLPSCELRLCKQLGILGNKEKKMFAQELASIKDLEEQEQAANKTTVAAEMPELTSMVIHSAACLICFRLRFWQFLPIFLNLLKSL